VSTFHHPRQHLVNIIPVNQQMSNLKIRHGKSDTAQLIDLTDFMHEQSMAKL
jgi:hypothetical protein